jgi:hypothetical protein
MRGSSGGGAGRLRRSLDVEEEARKAQVGLPTVLLPGCCGQDLGSSSRLPAGAAAGAQPLLAR